MSNLAKTHSGAREQGANIAYQATNNYCTLEKQTELN